MKQNKETRLSWKAKETLKDYTNIWTCKFVLSRMTTKHRDDSNILGIYAFGHCTLRGTLANWSNQFERDQNDE